MLRKLPGRGPVRISIGHAICPEKADRLTKLLRDSDLEISRISVCELGSAIGVHGGPGTLVVGIQEEPGDS